MQRKAEAALKLVEEGANREYWRAIQMNLEERKNQILADKEKLGKKQENLHKERENLHNKQENLHKERENLHKERENLHKERENLHEQWQSLQAAENRRLEQLLRELQNAHKMREGRERTVETSVRWTETKLDRRRLGHKEGGKLFCLDRSLLIPNSSGQAELCWLYCREDFNLQWGFLEEQVCKEGCLGWILGTPGTGKTMTTMSFMQSLSTEAGWRTMCVRIRKSGIVSIYQVDGDVQKKCEANAKKAAVFLENVLEAWAGESHKYFLSLDGFVEGTQVHEDLYSVCLLWRHGDWENRRLVITTSMSSRRMKHFGEDLEEKAKELKVCSWTLEEYQEAFKYDLLYESVVDVMGLGGDSKEGSSGGWRIARRTSLEGNLPAALDGLSASH
ncbi:hypothetical protein GUITHDRAFT_105622 [Guillardia theta CCMP2712]|uniref:Uncharacterized protein n=1 Tax=Guillardia theta (strain CCMP2712) TaxID=905079 RepID=L1JK65_GUITC|nr:hypothetical protein GUITHDRAFT_105622 [Guillardia theta CCMP2712]EKX48475.1 hypothetical protein GUITHDRAFT_105622 [Guillardia theta CCMP2712]|eukprot:XP_005835455.1 hypothetical protein GUITHDRAFT_105622 [Guillardia theta CCMP2712]